MKTIYFFSLFFAIPTLMSSQAQYDVELVQAFHDDELEYFIQDGWRFKNDFEFNAIVKNVGLDTLSGVFVNVEIPGNYNQNSDTIVLLPNQIDTLSIGSVPFIYSDIQVTYTAFATGDMLTGNNSHSRNLYLGSWWSNLASRSNGVIEGNWDLGYFPQSVNSIPFEVGCLFKPQESFCLNEVGAFIADSTNVGAIIYSNVYEKTDSGFYLMGYFQDYAVSSNSINNYATLQHSGPFWDSGPYLEANKAYLVTAGHYGGSQRFAIGYSSNLAPDSSAYYLVVP